MPNGMDLQPTIYTGYYKGTELTAGQTSPLRRRRAASKAYHIVRTGFLIAFAILWLAPPIVFGARIEADPLIRFIPLISIYWFLRWDVLAVYRNPHTHDYVALVFDLTFSAAAIALIATIPIAMNTYRFWLRRADGMPTEHGGARWILPDDLANVADPKDSLLPDDYDIYRGYGKRSRAAARHFAEQAKALRIERDLANHELDANEISM